jgi:hypothetical protein
MYSSALVGGGWSMPCPNFKEIIQIIALWDQDSVVSKATCYRVDGKGFESRWRRDFPHPSRPALGPTRPPMQWIPCLSWGWSGQGVASATHLPSSAEVKERVSAIPLFPLWAFVAWSRVTFIVSLYYGSQDSSVSIVTRLQAGWYRVWFLVGARYFAFLCNF